MSVPVSPYCLRHALGDVIKERYTVRAVLGAGAFGTVYRVEESLGSRTLTLACKEMHVLSDPQTARDERSEALQMFQEEAYVLQTLRHPNIPAAYFEPERGVWLACPVCGRTFKGQKTCADHGAALQVVRDRFYLMMDFIEGADLEETLTDNGGRPLDEERVLDYALQVSDALRAVHAKGLSHRDIKPANIKIQRDTDKAMLIDFGLVKPSAVVGGYGTILKRGSTGIGTLGYAPESPAEQARPDARTDILAFGMTLYRLLAGLDPTEPDQLAQMRAKNPNDFNLHLSAGTNAIIRRMTALDADARYPDVEALQQDLRAARFPVEVKCPFCGHLHRAPTAPPPGTLCEQCGRPFPDFETQNGNGVPGGARQPAIAGAKNGGAAAIFLSQSAISSTRSAAQPTLPRHNPYETQLRELRHEIDNLMVPHSHPNDARIAQIEAQFVAISRHSPPQMQCPGCRTRDLAEVSSTPNGSCPLCLAAQMERRSWKPDLCAVCREGELKTHALRGDSMFCAVCRHDILSDEHRRKMGGLLDDVWGVCPHCEAAFDIVSGHNARLDSFKSDPFGVATLHKGRTMPISQWKQIGTRRDEYSQCTSCAAQFDHVDATQRTLARAGNSDAFGVWAQFGGKTLPADDWGKMANGLPFPSGNVHCPNCRTEWNYDQKSQTLQLLSSETPLPDWALNWSGARPIEQWYLGAGGKSSGRPGLMCASCHTEFDHERNELLNLVGTSSVTLKPQIGQTLALRDWQRRGLGLPTEAEARQLKGELQRLQTQVNADKAQWNQSQQRQRTHLQSEWVELLKRAILNGFMPFRRLSAQSTPAKGENYVALRGDLNRAPLRMTEELRWESQANFWLLQADRGGKRWMPVSVGQLVITTERVLFSTRSNDKPNQWLISQLRNVEVQMMQNRLIIALAIYNVPQLVGLEIGEPRLEMIYGDQSYAIAISPLQLAALIKNLRVASS